MSFLAGLWLLMAPFALGHRSGDFDPRWNSVLVGFTVAVCSLVHAMAPRETPWAGPALLVAGAWLIVAPSPGPESAAVSDVVTGAVVMAAGLGAAARTAARRRHPRPAAGHPAVDARL